MFEKIIQDVVNKLFIQLGFPELVNVPISNIDFQYILNKKLPMIKEFISQQMKEITTDDYKEELIKILKEDILSNPEKYFTNIMEKDEKFQQFVQYIIHDYLSKNKP